MALQCTFHTKWNHATRNVRFDNLEIVCNRDKQVLSVFIYILFVYMSYSCILMQINLFSRVNCLNWLVINHRKCKIMKFSVFIVEDLRERCFERIILVNFCCMNNKFLVIWLIINFFCVYFHLTCVLTSAH